MLSPGSSSKENSNNENNKTNCIALLERMAKGWYQRARVRSAIDLDLTFDEDKSDFLETLLPFSLHPIYMNFSPKMKSTLLSCGWILYNAKTIAIEKEIVNPVCHLLLDEAFCTLDFLKKQLITETMVDETYHIHLCLYANELTKQQRKLPIHIGKFAFVQSMKECQANYQETWQQNIIQLITSITSEIYITDYLELMNHKENVLLQPINAFIVKTHRADELIHGKIFTHLAEDVFHKLDLKQKEFFAEMMPKAVAWLALTEFDLWQNILEQLKLKEANQLIQECKESLSHAKIDFINANKGIKDLVTLAENLGVLEYAVARDSFTREGFSGVM